MQHFFQILEVGCSVIFHTQYYGLLEAGGEFARKIKYSLKSDAIDRVHHLSEVTVFFIVI